MTERDEQLHTDDLAGRRSAAPTTTSEAAATEDAWSSSIDEGWGSLLGDTGEFSTRWETIQSGFVDEPRRAVEEADALVAQVIQRLAESFSTERGRLEAQWSRGDQVDTEDLRVALRRYRTFFEQLLRRSHEPANR